MGKVIFIVCIIIVSTMSVFAQEEDVTKLTGPYLGQTPPGMTPEIFAPRFISTQKRELICGYLGTSVLMELAIAYYLDKPVFFLNDYDRSQSYTLEVALIDPVIIHNNLSLIKSK